MSSPEPWKKGQRGCLRDCTFADAASLSYREKADAPWPPELASGTWRYLKTEVRCRDFSQMFSQEKWKLMTSQNLYINVYIHFIHTVTQNINNSSVSQEEYKCTHSGKCIKWNTFWNKNLKNCDIHTTME